MYNINIAFLEEYKKLDALCKDMFGGMDGVLEYIRQIEALPESEKMLCRDTKAVYDRLKNLRWIRNCLAHEIGTWDEEICTEADIEWLKNFYDRILAINDPLAFICKVKRARESDRKTPAGSSRNSSRIPRAAAVIHVRFCLMLQSSSPPGCAGAALKTIIPHLPRLRKPARGFFRHGAEIASPPPANGTDFSRIRPACRRFSTFYTNLTPDFLLIYVRMRKISTGQMYYNRSVICYIFSKYLPLRPNRGGRRRCKRIRKVCKRSRYL